jgi:hypothetical protein
VALLDSLGGQRPERSEVLRQPDRPHDLGKLTGGFHTEQAEVDPRTGVRLQGSADDAHLQRDLELTAERAGLGDGPAGERRVLAGSRRIGVGTRFERPPVVAGGHGNRIDPIHDALVVGCGAVGVDFGELARNHDAVAHLLAVEAVVRQLLERDFDGRADQCTVGQIGHDAEEHAAPGHLLDQRGHSFAHGVDQVGAHGVAGVHQQVDDEHLGEVSPARVQDHLEVGRSAAACHQPGMEAVGQVEYLLLALQQVLARAARVRHVDDLDLADQDGLGAPGPESAGGTYSLGREVERGYHRGLLDAQGHHVVLAVDQEVERQAEREPHHSDHVLDHGVGVGQGEQPVAAEEGLGLLLGQQTAVADRPHTLGDRELVKAAQFRFVH